MNKITPALVAAGLAFLGLGHVHAQTTLYQDTFQDTDSLLDTQAPTTAVTAFGASASATWSGSATFTESTSTNVLSLPSTNVNPEYLTFTPQSGVIYNLSATLTNGAGVTDNWVAFGFISNTGTPIYSGGGAPWMLLKSSGAVESYGGPGTAGGDKTSSTGAGIVTNNTMTITLDTTTTLWTYQFSYLASNGTTLLTSATTAYATNPTIIAVGIASYNTPPGTRTLDNFTLTATAIPEPSAYALMIGAAGLVTAGVLRHGRRS